MSTTLKYSKDKKVVFDEGPHTYMLGKRQLTSVTTFLSRFKNSFDREGISKAYAKKHKVSQTEVLADWDQKRDFSCEMGTAVHKIFEDYIDGKGIIASGTYPKEQVAIDFIYDYFVSGKLTPIESELIVYDTKKGLAGQIDCLAKKPDGTIVMLDWKTNKELNDTGFAGQRMKQPYTHLQDCNLNHYAMQLDTYKSMCKEYDIKKTFIVHIGFDKYKVIETKEIL